MPWTDPPQPVGDVVAIPDNGLSDDTGWEDPLPAAVFAGDSPGIRLRKGFTCDQGMCDVGGHYNGSAGVVKYRWWLHNGLYPSEEQVPWLTLPGSRRFYVGEAGIVSIQLANENSQGELARRSNVVNKRLGFDTAGAELPSPAALPTVTPQPAPEDGATRPVSPAVSRVEVLANGDDLKVSLSSAWSGNLEYRIWAHTGRYPGGSGGWKPLAVSGYSFIVSGVSGERGWWWAQARAAAGADGLAGEPTAAKSFYLDPPPPVRPTPMPTHFPTATPLPDLAGGATRPAAPAISRVELTGTGDTWRLKVTLSSNYSGTVQFRVWQNTGNPPSDAIPWVNASMSGRTFTAAPSDSLLPADQRPEGYVLPGSGDKADVAYSGWWWVEARLLSSGGGRVPGNPGRAKSFYVDPRPVD